MFLDNNTQSAISTQVKTSRNIKIEAKQPDNDLTEARIIVLEYHTSHPSHHRQQFIRRAASLGQYIC